VKAFEFSLPVHVQKKRGALFKGPAFIQPISTS